MRAHVEYPGRVAENHYGKFYQAICDIEPGTVVEIFSGPVVSFDAVPDDEIIYAACCGDGNWMIPNTNARYMNHSCDPNCKIAPNGEVVAIKQIRKDEEITFDYVTVAREEWERSPQDFFWDNRWSFDCQCGASHCYKRIDRYYVKG